uniref:Uncharacterized protein n=1 Tax=viral metagenome TaxID=1070528 RepID=A0A6M3K1R5_9ZZZZ
MSKKEETKPRRLVNLRINEVSLVDAPANKRSFLLFKRDGEGGTVDLEEVKKQLELAVAEKAALVKELETVKADLAKKVEELEKVKAPEIKKKADLTEDELTKDLTEYLEVFKVGKTISEKNLKLIKDAVSALQTIIDKMGEMTEKDALTKQYETLPEDKKKEVASMLEDMNKKLDEKLASSKK